MRYITAALVTIVLACGGYGDRTLLGQGAGGAGSADKTTARNQVEVGKGGNHADGLATHAFAALDKVHFAKLNSRSSAVVGLAAIGFRMPVLNVVARLPLFESATVLPLWLASNTTKSEPSASVKATPVAFALEGSDDLNAAIDAAKAKYQAVSGEQVAAAKANLDQQVAALDTFLASDKTAEEGWKDFLRFKRLQDELAKGNDAKIEVLRDAASRFASGQAGLEVEPFLNVRAARGPLHRLAERKPRQEWGGRLQEASR